MSIFGLKYKPKRRSTNRRKAAEDSRAPRGPEKLADPQQHYPLLRLTHPQYLMAASCVTMLPRLLLFFAAQRYFVESHTMSGLKG